MVRLVRICGALLMASLIVQLATHADFRGYPFLAFGIAVATISSVRLWAFMHNPVEKPE